VLYQTTARGNRENARCRGRRDDGVRALGYDVTRAGASGESIRPHRRGDA
jgi:hypothetical protein